jgi:hypothetical protein
MRKALALTGLAVITTVSLAAGVTFALFSSASVAQTDSIETGRLCISSLRLNGQAVPGPMFYVTSEQGTAVANGTTYPGLYPTKIWWPGRSLTRGLLLLNGTDLQCADAKIDSVQAFVTSGDTVLAQDMTVVISAWKYDEETADFAWVEVARAPLDSFLTGPVPLAERLPLQTGGGRQDLQFRVTLNREAGNQWQGQTLVITFQVNASQARNN